MCCFCFILVQLAETRVYWCFFFLVCLNWINIVFDFQLPDAPEPVDEGQEDDDEFGEFEGFEVFFYYLYLQMHNNN